MIERQSGTGKHSEKSRRGLGVCVAAVLFLYFAALPARAADIEMHVVHPLSFGSFAVARNDVPVELTITPDNDVIAESGIVPGGHLEAQRGEYFFTGLPENVTFRVGVEFPSAPNEGGIVFNTPVPVMGPGPDFTLSDFTIGNGGILQTNSDGEATLYLGATLRTSGTMQRYTSGSFSGTITFRLYHEGEEE